jgi:hypothetical protein
MVVSENEQDVWLVSREADRTNAADEKKENSNQKTRHVELQKAVHGEPLDDGLVAGSLTHRCIPCQLEVAL